MYWVMQAVCNVLDCACKDPGPVKCLGRRMLVMTSVMKFHGCETLDNNEKVASHLL